MIDKFLVLQLPLKKHFYHNKRMSLHFNIFFYRQAFVAGLLLIFMNFIKSYWSERFFVCFDAAKLLNSIFLASNRYLCLPIKIIVMKTLRSLKFSNNRQNLLCLCTFCDFIDEGFDKCLFLKDTIACVYVHAVFCWLDTNINWWF